MMRLWEVEVLKCDLCRDVQCTLLEERNAWFYDLFTQYIVVFFVIVV